MDANGGTAEPEEVVSGQECECNRLKQELRRLHDKFTTEQTVKKYLEGKVEEAAQKIADLQKQVAAAEKKAESFSRGNDELSKRLANLHRQNDQLVEEARFAKEELVERINGKPRKSQYNGIVLSNVLLERRAETAEKKAEEADRRVFEAENKAAEALEAAKVAKRAEEASTAKAAEAVAAAVKRCTDAETRTQQMQEQLSLSEEKRGKAEAAAAEALESAVVRATVKDLVLDAELLQTNNAIDETLRKLAATEKEAKEAQNHAAYLETKRIEAERLADEAIRSVNEANERAADASRRVVAMNDEVEQQRKVASEAMTRADNAEATAENAQRRLSETRQQLDLERQRAADAERRSSDAERRAEDATHEATDVKSKLASAECEAAKAQRLVAEAEVKARDAETERDEAARRAEEALRKVTEVTDQAALAKTKFTEATTEIERQADNLRKLASEARSRAESAEARAEGSEQSLLDALQQLAVERQRADDAERRAVEAELRLDSVTRDVEDHKNKLTNAERLAAISDRKAVEFELKVKDAEKRADYAEREITDANKSAADAYRRIADAEKKVEEARERKCQAERKVFDADAKAREQVAEAERRATEATRKAADLENEKVDLLRKINALQGDLERKLPRSKRLRDDSSESILPTTSRGTSGNEWYTSTSSSQSTLGHAVYPIVRSGTGSSKGGRQQRISLIASGHNGEADNNTGDCNGSLSGPSDVPATPSVNCGPSLGEHSSSKKARYATVAAIQEDSPLNRHGPGSRGLEPSATETSACAKHPSREADVIKPDTIGVGGFQEGEEDEEGIHQSTHGPTDDLLLAQFRAVEVVVDLSTFNVESPMTSDGGTAASTGSTRSPRMCASGVKHYNYQTTPWTSAEDAALKKILIDRGFLSPDGRTFNLISCKTASPTFASFLRAHQFRGKFHRRSVSALRQRCTKLFSTADHAQKSKN